MVVFEAAVANGAVRSCGGVLVTVPSEWNRYWPVCLVRCQPKYQARGRLAKSPAHVLPNKPLPPISEIRYN